VKEKQERLRMKIMDAGSRKALIRNFQQGETRGGFSWITTAPWHPTCLSLPWRPLLIPC
jgi:hypothetical protein